MNAKPISLHDWASKGRKTSGWKPGAPIRLPSGRLCTFDSAGRYSAVRSKA